jgi:hypothetical protein
LSTGELAFALGALHWEEEATNLVQIQFGLSLAEDTELVLAASAHSLLARNLISLTAQTECELAAELEQAVSLLMESEWMIQCNRVVGDKETFVSFHFGRGGILKQSLRDGAIQVLKCLPDIRDVAAEAAIFYAVPEVVAQVLPSVRLRQDVVEEIRDSQERAFIEGKLSQHGVPLETLRALTDDFLTFRSRGSIVRVDHHKNGISMAEQRLFLLGADARFWLIKPESAGAESTTNFSLASRQHFEHVFLSVIRDKVPFGIEK